MTNFIYNAVEICNAFTRVLRYFCSSYWVPCHDFRFTMALLDTFPSVCIKCKSVWVWKSACLSCLSGMTLKSVMHFTQDPHFSVMQKQTQFVMQSRQHLEAETLVMLSQHMWPPHDTPPSITSFQTQAFLHLIVWAVVPTSVNHLCSKAAWADIWWFSFFCITEVACHRLWQPIQILNQIKINRNPNSASQITVE